MMWKMLVGACLAVASPSVLAQAACADLSKAVEFQLKKAASSSAEGITDNSAPRATLRELRISNSLALVGMNLTLMAQNKCPPRQKPVNPMIYFGEALDCEIATQKGEKDSPRCKMDTWQGVIAPASGSPG